MLYVLHIFVILSLYNNYNSYNKQLKQSLIHKKIDCQLLTTANQLLTIKDRFIYKNDNHDR